MTFVDNFRRPLKCDFHACKQTREKFGEEARFRLMPQLNFTDYGIHGKFVTWAVCGVELVTNLHKV